MTSSTTSRRRRTERGLTLLEVAVAGAVSALAAAGLIVVLRTTLVAVADGTRVAAHEQHVRQAMDGLLASLRGSGADDPDRDGDADLALGRSLPAVAGTPEGAGDTLALRSTRGVDEAGALVWDAAPATYALVLDEGEGLLRDGMDGDGDGLIDECVLVQVAAGGGVRTVVRDVRDLSVTLQEDGRSLSITLAYWVRGSTGWEERTWTGRAHLRNP